MNTTTTLISPFASPNADRIGVAASVLCAIHCALAPVLLLALPTFGRVWAHPASHILVALFVVPLAAFSIRKGYRIHQKRWIAIVASIGILLVLGGAALPAFGKESHAKTQASEQADSSASPAAVDDSGCGSLSEDSESTEASGCVDACCPSLQISETGETSLHIPPAAIVTTLGGLFLIIAHVGNLCFCGHACRAGKCTTCAVTS